MDHGKGRVDFIGGGKLGQFGGEVELSGGGGGKLPLRPPP